MQWKGGVIAPSWGLSLDFVPHVSGSRLRWHRTPKSAMLDLRVDSRDRALDLPYHRGSEPVRLGASRVAEAASEQALELWNSARSEAELLPAFRRVARYYAAHSGLDFYAFVQHPLALAVLYARSQQNAAAMAELSRYHQYGRGDEDLDLALRMVIDGAGAA
jgi:hypothetical protein